MGHITLIGGCLVFAFAVTTDAKKTIALVTAIISIRGITYIVQKVTASVNIDNSKLIDMTGWALAGLPFIGLLKLARKGFDPISGTVMNIYNGFNSIATGIEKVGTWFEHFGK